MISVPQCARCKHRHPGKDWTCEAFPDGIPRKVWLNELDHRKAVKGDHGIRFEPDEEGEPEETAKAVGGGVPSSERILAAALKRCGYSSNAKLLQAQRARVTQEVRELAIQWLKREAERFVVSYGEPPATKAIGETLRQAADKFFGRAKSFLRNAFTAGVAAMLGSAKLHDAEMAKFEAAFQAEVDYLDGFQQAVLDEEQPINVGFIARAKSYGASVWGAANNVNRVRKEAEGLSYERRLHRRSDQPCPDCVEERAKGWVDTGTLRDIGDTECGERCHCVFVFTNDPTVDWPLNEGWEEHSDFRGVPF